MTVQESGGLPDYICRIAKAVRKTGKTTSEAIAIAVSRVKKWASGVGVNKDTQAKAAAAVAEWEKLRAKSHAKSAAEKVAASAAADNILVLSDSVSSFNTDAVRAAWRKKSNPSPMTADCTSFIRELWTDHLITQKYDGDGQVFQRIDYSVAADGTVTFETPVDVKVSYVTLSADDMIGKSITDSDLERLIAATPPCHRTATDKVLLSIKSSGTFTEQLLALSSDKPYGDVRYADPGYNDGTKRYPIDTPAHIRAAWSYINMEKNQSAYTAAQVAAIKGRIRAAAKKSGIEISG